MGKYKKRGQITIFIILGIIILFGSATYFYLKNQMTNIQPNTIELKKTTALDPYVESCLDLTTRQALDIIGATGGYIEYPIRVKNDPASYLKISPIAELRMPYWWYAGENRIPPLDMIEEEIEAYVETHLDECIDNFSSINGYDVTKTGPIDVDLTFADQDIDVKLKYPLRAVKVPEQNEFSLNDYDFFIKVPIRFREIYGVAKKIMEDENKEYFMEKWTMDLISLDDTGKDESTPLMNMDFRLRPYIWKLPVVQKEVKTLLTQNSQYVKFAGTDYNAIPDTMPYMQNHFVWNFDNPENTHPNIRVGLTYNPNWKPFRIDVSPTKATQLKSGQTQFGSVLSFAGIQMWHFTYDLVYPVMVTVNDEGNAKSDPYTFSYAFLVSIQNNQPYRQNFGSTIFTKEDSPSDEEVCDYLINTYDTEITVSTYNNYTDKPLKGVNLTFTCGRSTCPLGKTTWTQNGATAALTAKFPHCPLGFLRGYKEGYEDIQLPMSAVEPTWVTLHMKPVKEFKNFTLVKHAYLPKNKVENQLGLPEELKEGEQALIIINSPVMKEQYLTLPINDSEMMSTLKFYKDKQFAYNVTIYLFSVGEKEEDSKLLGAYEAEISPLPDEILNTNSITFHVLEYHTTSDEELGMFLAGIRSYSEKISKPEFKTTG